MCNNMLKQSYRGSMSGQLGVGSFCLTIVGKMLCAIEESYEDVVYLAEEGI